MSSANPRAVFHAQAPVPASRYARPWQQALPAFLGLLLWILFLYQETWAAMVQIWARSDTFAHAYFVPPISLWLIWRQRALLSKMTPTSALSPLLSMGVLVGLWFIGSLASVNALTQLSLVGLLVLSVPAILGWGVSNVILFPLLFLFFAVPLGEFLMPVLMDWTAQVTVFSLRLTGIPVYREGLQFIISSGHWSVVEACSGIRYLIASITVGTLFSYLSFTSTKRRILFVGVSILVPVVANWMRAYLIVLLGHFSDNKLATGVDHLIYGWIFFGIVIFSMFMIGARWSEPEALPNHIGPLLPKPPPAASHLKTLVTLLSSVLVVALPHLAMGAYDKPSDTPSPVLSLPQALSAHWTLQTERTPEFKPDFKNPTTEVNRIYVHQGQSVSLYLGFYQHQTPARKLISFSNVLVPSQDAQWAQVTHGRHSVVLAQSALDLKTSGLQKILVPGSSNPERLLVWQFYWVGGILTTNDYLAKAYAAYRRLSGREDDSAVIVIATKDDQSDQASHTLETFLQDNYATLDSILTSLVLH